ncbi:MAG: hypothetical protein WD749_11830 [Phycisphaerales bacterium]
MRTLALAAPLALALSAAADTVIVTQNAVSTAGTGGYTTLLFSQPRSWLTVIGEAELAGRLPAGAVITGVSWRLWSWQAQASYPPVPAICSNFDIYLGQAARTPGNLDLADASNNWGPDLTAVRTGSLQMAPGYFPGGALTPNRNPFCPPIEFSTPYTYVGGPLLIMVRHTGTTGGTGGLDWVNSHHGTSGAQGIAVASYTSNTGWGGGGNGGAIAMQFTWTLPQTCYANCDDSTTAPVLNVADFGCFLTRYAAGEAYANCDQSTTAPALNVADFGCFLTKYAAGCP